MSIIIQWQDEHDLDPRKQSVATLHEHLVYLPGDEWGLWRCLGVRSAGFPANGILKLAAPACGEAADGVVRAEQKAERAWQLAIEALEGEIAQSEGEIRAGLINGLRSLKKGSAPKMSVVTGTATLIRDFEIACAQVATAWDQYQSVFVESVSRVSDSIREIAGSVRFREAITWQNRRALHGSLDALLRMPQGSTSRGAERKKREEAIANYWQRYSMKNDTIGFFGPVGWARFISQGEPLSVNPGPSLLADRKVFFEVWCIDTLAERLAQDAALLPWIAPRRMPYIYVDDQIFYAPEQLACSPTPEDLAILRLCDGERTAKEIARALLASMALNREETVYQRLARLRDAGIISWSFQVPSNARTEIGLRKKLERIEEEELREQALAGLDELERGRAGVAAAAGDAARLDEAMSELEAAFTRLTGSASTRNEGKTYAGRTLVYEDCRRDLEVEIGPAVIKEMSGALSLLLKSARWVTHEVGERYRRAFTDLYRQMVADSGSTVISAIDFWERIQTSQFSIEGSLVEPCFSLLRQRWSEILSIAPGERRVSYSSEQLWQRVADAFDSPGPGWQEARYHCPDLMIAAASVDDIRHGNYQLVLGEIHVARNTLGYSVFLEQHPRVEELFKAVELDLIRPRLLSVPPRYVTGRSSRVYLELLSKKDYRLEFSRDAPASEESQSLTIGELVVEAKDGGLIVRTRDGQVQIDIIDAFGEALSGQVVNSFSGLIPGRHTPRISIDRLVINRETWRFSASEMDFASEKDDASRYLEARRWSISHHIPRFIFIKTQVEVKPLFVDLDSPLLINLFAKMVRQASEKLSLDTMVTVTEMLPRPEQSWLPDAEGNRYTSELRVVAVDLKT